MTTTFEEARVGDRVWSLISGWGKVTAVDFGCEFPIQVEFEYSGCDETYLKNGAAYRCEPQTLFWDEIKFTAPPMPERVRYKNVNGFKVPDVAIDDEYDIRFYYFVPMPVSVALYEMRSGNPATAAEIEHRIKCGCCYPCTEAGKTAAKAHALAWLGEGEPWTD